jgi:hypothetical protein
MDQQGEVKLFLVIFAPPINHRHLGVSDFSVTNFASCGWYRTILLEFRTKSHNKLSTLNRLMNDEELIPMFRRQCIITVADDLIDPSGFNLKNVPDRLYRVFAPAFPEERHQLCCVLSPDDSAILYHMVGVRHEAFGVIGEEYLFIRAYRVGHTLDLDLVLVVVEAQIKGGAHCIDDDGHIGGDGKGHWYGVLCPAEAQAQLVADLKAEEARRRKSLPEAVFRRRPSEDDDDNQWR